MDARPGGPEEREGRKPRKNTFDEPERRCREVREGPEKSGRKTKRGFPERYARRDPPTCECGGVLLSHTLSSAVPSPCQALASGFGKGPGVSPGPWPPQNHSKRPTPNRDRPATEPATRPIPVVAVREPDNGRKQIKRLTSIVVTTRNSVPCHPTRKPPQDETRPARVGKSVPRSPVSTGRLHPSRDFHLRPIEHVFNMRATNAPRSVKES